MNNQYTKGTPITVNWFLRKPDGEVYSLYGYQYTLKGRNSRGDIIIPSSIVNLENGYVSFVLTDRMQTSTGFYSFYLDLYMNGKLMNTLVAFDAIEIIRNDTDSTITTGENHQNPVAKIYSVGQYNLFAPSAPVAGSDGYWYFDGARIKDDQGNDIPVNVTLRIITEGEDAGLIIIDEGRETEQVITNLKTALTTAAEDHTQALADHTQAAEDHTNELQRQLNEQTRQSNETTRQSNEQTRIGQETVRQLNESTRQTNESTRRSNETTRQSNESIRQTNESTRQSNESTRETRSNSDHTRAETDHTRAETDHTRTETDHGKAISQTIVAYAEGTDAVNIPTSGWQEAIPSVAAGNFLWTRTTLKHNGTGIPDTVGYSATMVTDNSVKTVAQTLTDAQKIQARENIEAQGVCHIITHTLEETQLEDAEPGVLHTWEDPVPSLRILSLAEPEHDDRENEYRFQFTASPGWAQDESLFPEGIRWIEEPDITPGNTYEVSIVNGLGIIAEFENE